MKHFKFESFFQGGFECSTHIRRDGLRRDVINSTAHDINAGQDYKLLASVGIRTVRDGLRWHLIETAPGVYDWSSFLPMLRAAREAGTQVVWDLLHYGWPDDLDIWSPQFVDRFEAFAGAVARLFASETDDVPLFVPVNEISFTAWAAGQFAVFYPFGQERGDEMKIQLVRSSIAAMEAIWNILPQARFIHIEPAINVIPDSADPQTQAQAFSQNQAQFAAWNMLAGLAHPQLGGARRYMDIIGINYYCHNQWMVNGGPIDVEGPLARSFTSILQDNYARYGCDIVIAETGIEDDLRPGWLRYVCQEVLAAIRSGVPVQGICLYPIMNHPGWDDDRHCPNGLIDYSPRTLERWIFEPLREELARQQRIFNELALARSVA